jgi:hypothetical protein
MGLQKVVSRETATEVSRVLGAQLLVKGAVTEFEQKAGGGGMRLGVGVGLFGGSGGGQSTQGVVGMDIRLIDTVTGQVLQSQHVSAKIEQKGVSADLNASMVTLGGDLFSKTVLGEATRQAIEKGVDLIIRSMDPLPWTGLVVEATGEDVYINAGASSGIKVGDVFSIVTVERELTDPASGAVIAVIEKPLGQVRVTTLQDKYAVARMSAPFQTRRGDLVKLSP